MIAYLLDTETTGLLDNHLLPLEKQPEVVEYFGCLADLDTGEILNEFGTLLRPQRPIPDEVAGITHITNAMVADAPTFGGVGPAIFEAIGAAPIVIAHNLSFDKEILDIEAERLGRTIAWPRTLCTVEATVHLRGYRLGLQTLHELLFDMKFDEAHRARPDTMALLRCACELARRDLL